VPYWYLITYNQTHFTLLASIQSSIRNKTRFIPVVHTTFLLIYGQHNRKYLLSNIEILNLPIITSESKISVQLQTSSGQLSCIQTNQSIRCPCVLRTSPEVLINDCALYRKSGLPRIVGQSNLNVIEIINRPDRKNKT
jgi:hypothetical protein